jgi:hypothetical protein
MPHPLTSTKISSLEGQNELPLQNQSSRVSPNTPNYPPHEVITRMTFLVFVYYCSRALVKVTEVNGNVKRSLID